MPCSSGRDGGADDVRVYRRRDQATLDRELDDLIAGDIVLSLEQGDVKWPRLTELLQDLIEERARELADTDAIETEMERRATERARWLFEREVGAMSGDPPTELRTRTNRRPDTPTAAAATRRVAILRPPGVEPDAGFRRGRGGIRRMRPG